MKTLCFFSILKEQADQNVLLAWTGNTVQVCTNNNLSPLHSRSHQTALRHKTHHLIRRSARGLCHGLARGTDLCALQKGEEKHLNINKENMIIVSR